MKGGEEFSLARQWWAAFSGLAPAHGAVDVLANASQPRRLTDGDVLLREADENDSVYLVASGALRTVRHTRNGHEVWYADVNPGEVVGELAALTSTPRTSSVIAKNDVLVFAVDRDTFLNVARDHPDFAMTVVRMLARRLHATSNQVADLVAHSVSNRLHGELARMGAPTADDSEIFEIASPPTVSALGQRIHATREATSRALADLEARGLVRRIATSWIVLVPSG